MSLLRYMPSKLLRTRLPITFHACKQHLLVERWGRCDVTTSEVREKLKQLVGASKHWGSQESQPPVRLAESQAELPACSMIDSYQEACIPLGQNSELRQKYVNFFNTVRFGRISEDLDTMAVWISYTHNVGREPKEICPYSIVTALVDRISLNNAVIQPDKDILLRGHVTWVGNTSIEVSMVVDQMRDSKWTKLLDAKFLMVARNPQTKGKAYVSPLKIATEEERTLFNIGEKNKAKRQQEKEMSLFKTPPNEEERNIIHNLFLQTLDKKIATFKHAVKPPGSVWMADTLLKNFHICFPEERNIYNKIFGGFLMRKAYEVAWGNACLYCKSRPAAIAVDDIMFRRPVEVGSLLFLSSQVAYTEGPYMEVKVHAETVHPKTAEHETTNIFYYCFKSQAGDVPGVIPKSYAEYMMFVDGKRHFEASMKTESV